MGRRIKINSCAPRDIMELPGVGRRMTEQIMQVRKAHMNITPDTFKSLGIRDYASLLDRIDFAPWTDSFDNEDSGELSEDETRGYASTSMPGPSELEDWQSSSDRHGSLYPDPERQEHDAFLERMRAATHKLQGPPKNITRCLTTHLIWEGEMALLVRNRRTPKVGHTILPTEDHVTTE